ncbi:MAG: ABC transporter ATP-binding protein [Patescibacteria group bacterium]
MKALSVSNLEKIYANGVQALKGVSLNIEEGDFFALLGPNGAGKTTIIGITCGLVNKTGGTVRVFGRDIDQSLDEAKSFIGLVPQEMNFNIFERVEDIVVDQAGFYGIPQSVARKDAEKYLKQLGLWEKRNDKSMTLSGGMKRRLLIARALIHHPKLLILDEPTAGVDIELRRGMWDFLRELTNEKGITIILTTHYLEEAEQLCKNVAIINKGEIVEQGSMQKVLSGLNKETFILYLKNPMTDHVLSAIHKFHPKRVDDATLEASVSNGDTVTELIETLKNNQIQVGSMRNKSNRLEEVFVSLISK